MQHLAEPVPRGVSRVSNTCHRHGPGNGYELPFPATEKHEELANSRRASVSSAREARDERSDRCRWRSRVVSYPSTTDEIVWMSSSSRQCASCSPGSTSPRDWLWSSTAVISLIQPSGGTCTIDGLSCCWRSSSARVTGSGNWDFHSPRSATATTPSSQRAR